MNLSSIDAAKLLSGFVLGLGSGVVFGFYRYFITSLLRYFVPGASKKS
jgi:ABC-type thiamin/hydroxymethylpyrimidine transport system permease subunit